MTSHLIVPDPHVKPDQSLQRFNWLADLVLDLRPTHVICLGDWYDFESLLGKIPDKSLVSREVHSGQVAQSLLFNKIKKRKKKMPKFWMIEGNHDKRIEKVPWDVDLWHSKWEFIPYEGKTPGILELDGIHYSHFFTSGNMGYAVTSAYSLIQKYHSSDTCGHSHYMDYSTDTDAMGKRIHALMAGCFFEDFADYAGSANRAWWKGVVFKENIENGDYDLNTISMKTMRENYD